MKDPLKRFPEDMEKGDRIKAVYVHLCPLTSPAPPQSPIH